MDGHYTKDHGSNYPQSHVSELYKATHLLPLAATSATGLPALPSTDVQMSP